MEEGGYSHIRALFALGVIKLAGGKAMDAESLFAEALAMGGRQWGADDPRVERLTSDIDEARSSRATNGTLDASRR